MNVIPNINTEQVERLLLKAQMDLDDAVKFEDLHKRAFRTAFDFLHQCFPPARSSEYWEATVNLFKKRVEDDKANILTAHLLLGVYEYLSVIVKDLPEQEEPAQPASG